MTRGVAPTALALIFLALLASGCVAGAERPSPTDPHEPMATTAAAVTTTTSSTADALASYRACMADEGVAIGEIPLDGLGRPRLADALAGLDLSERSVLDALEACGHHLSAGALDSKSDRELGVLVQARLEDFADCVRLEGVEDYPDPVPSFHGLGSPFPINRVPWTDPGLPTAVTRCTGILAGP